MTDSPPALNRALLQAIAESDATSVPQRLRALRLLHDSEPRQRVRREPDQDPPHGRVVELLAQWHEGPDGMPVVSHHHGIPLHGHQDKARLAKVKREIDAVLLIQDPETLFAIAGNLSAAPEARLTAHARYRVLSEERSAIRMAGLCRLDEVAARTAGLSCLGWADPWRYCSLLDVRMSGAPAPAPRPPKFAAEMTKFRT